MDDFKEQSCRKRGGEEWAWILLIIVIAAVCSYFVYKPRLEETYVLPEGTEDSYGMDKELVDGLEGKYAKVDMGIFNGSYKADDEKIFSEYYAQLETLEGEEKRNMMTVIEFLKSRFENSRIADGEIRSGKELIQSFVLTRAEIEGNVLEGRALWHEDVYDPGDCAMVNVRLELEGDTLRFWHYVEDEEAGEPIILQRVNEKE